jgi:WD40 repeat protein
VHNYTKFCIDLLKNRIFIGTDGGIIEIYSTTQSPYQKVGKLRVSGFGNISDLFYEKNNSRLFVCDKNGKISIFEIGDVGKEKISLEISQFGFKNAFNSIKYDNSKKEIITGDILGKITIWNIKRGEPIYSLNAHEKMAINSTFYLEDKRLIITGGRDKSVKFWKFPEFWFDEKIKKYENEDLVKINNELKKKRIQMEKIIEGNNEVNYESDISENEEELNGWNYDSDDVEDYDNINAPK